MEDRTRNIMVTILGLFAFLANGDNYAAAPLIINIAKDLHITVSTATISVTAYMLAFGVFTLIFGPLSDRFGKVKIINIAAFGTSIFNILGFFAFNLPSLALFRAMAGAFGAGIFPVTMALVGQSFGDKDRHKALGKVMGLMFLGAATATAIGGAISYFGSWRLVYLAYGVGELILSLIMLKALKRDVPVVSQLKLVDVYKKPLSDKNFLKLVLTIFPLGFAVFGGFTFTGTLIQSATGFNLLFVGLILSLFGVGTVLGGRIAPKIKQKLGRRFFWLAGTIGALSAFGLASSHNAWLLGLSLFGFGCAFIMLQSTLITTAQQQMPQMRGTAMSLTSFNMFVGGALGTGINGQIMKSIGVSQIFIDAALLIAAVSLLAFFFVQSAEQSQLAMRNRK